MDNRDILNASLQNCEALYKYAHIVVTFIQAPQIYYGRANRYDTSLDN